MFTPENRQKDFFDTQLYDRRVNNTHELMRIKQEVDWQFVEEKTRKYYSMNNGRPGYPPGKLFRMLFLEFYGNHSDVDVCDQVEVNLRYQKFVGIGMDDEIPEPTTLVEFRNRLGEKGFKELFSELVKQLKQKGLMSEKVAAIDATHVVADVATPSLINLLRQGRRKIMWQMGKRDASWRKTLEEKYPSERLKILGKAKQKQIQEECETTRTFLEELKKYWLNDDIELNAEELSRLVNGESGLISFEDMDARWGYKREDKPFPGYKVHTSMDDSGIVTSADTISGEKNEAGDIGEMIQQDKDKGITSECIAADGLYDTAPTYTMGEEHDVPIYTPCRHGPKKLEKYYFFFDKDGNLRCRNYCYGYHDLVEGNRKRYSFYASDCQSCLSKGSCLKKGVVQRSIWLNKCCEESMRQDQATRREALEKRKRIEAKFGQAKKWHLLNRARYRGRWKVSIQALMTFFVMNTKRLVKLMQEAHAPPGIFEDGFALNGQT